MFKLESYITPILLSYVDRYINNFRPEDSQVSLWGGDASFHNLELNLQVLEQELQLPFSFVSGSIRELLIHVPWTKLASEPITITINTIECILNLKGTDSTTRIDTTQTREKQKKTPNHGKEVEAPPGYVQQLINKIVSNIRIYCNNVILKYVEEDIVLSINVKLLKFESANEKWEPAYTDLSPAQVILRKVITVNDLTLCLDKRNASGKIEVYLEPMLYRCSLTMHLLRHYHSATASKASTTRLDILCNNMEFSMTEQQVPMFIRLILLLHAFQQKQLKAEKETAGDNTSLPPEMRENSEHNESWTGWAWSYVTSVLPAPWDEEWNTEQLEDQSGHTLHFGFYVDNLSITFKVSETRSGSGSYYSQKKLRYNPMLTLQLQGIYSETVIHGLRWFNSMGGVSQALLLPVGFCSCGHPEIKEESAPNPYLKIGSVSTAHKTDSLFDAEAVENKGQRRQYNTSWDFHMMTNTESVLLERTPAFSFDYVYKMELPSDMSSEVLSELGSDYEYSNLAENGSLRICLGPLKLRLCSGLFHRTNTLKVAADYYDYPPYYNLKPDLSLQELLPPSEEDFDALNEFIPSRSVRLTIFAPIIELELMDHPYFQPTKTSLFRKRKKQPSFDLSSQPIMDLPKLTLECQFIDVSLTNPMYVNRLVHTTCQLPDPPKKLFDACYSHQNIKVLGISSRLILNPQSHSTILTPSSISYSCKTILKPQYWTNADIPHVETTFESESITLNGTNAKMMVIACIIDKMLKVDAEGAIKMINSTMLLSDAAKDIGLPYMELCIEGIRFHKVVTNSTVSMNASVGSIKAFISESVIINLTHEVKTKKVDCKGPCSGNKQKFSRRFNSADIQQVLFISGPEPKSSDQQNEKLDDLPLFTATLQYPLNPDVQKHPPILLFNLQEIRICIDPLLCRWLLYKPKQLIPKPEDDSNVVKPKNISETSGSLIIETPRRISNQMESVHSSSDREPLQLPPRVCIPPKEESVDMQERIYNILKVWFDVWKGMLLCGDILQCTIYFPLVSLSAVGSQGIQEAVEAAVNKEHPPDIMVITLPFANVRSAQRQSITKYLKALPITLPEGIWSPDRSSFPWTMSISDLSCYTIQYGNKLTFLRPISLSATVGLSTRPSKVEGKGENDVPLNPSGSSTKSDIGSLGVCVHIDMRPIVVSTSEVQVYLFASILYGLMEVASNLLPEKSKPTPKSPDVVPPMVTKSSTTLSPTVIRENTVESASEKTPSHAGAHENVDSDSVKLTAWVQWTITKFTIELLSNEYNVDDELESLQPRMKLVIDAEDIVSSLDFQSVYLKIKSKVGSVSIRHFKRTTPNSKWTPGPFSGVVMRLREDTSAGQLREDNGFISVTITRASCRHTHTLWGAVQKKHKEKKSEAFNAQLLSQSRYITEIVVNIQPIDFLISLQTLRSFYLVLMPLLQLSPKKEVAPKNTSSTNFLTLDLNLNNQILPLAYLECLDIRVVMPSSELLGTGGLHDVVVFQVNKICLSPTAINPICRRPIRPDIYEQAAHARILNIPGSEVEDRQYQLDIIGLSLSTGVWDDIGQIFSPSASVLSSLRSMSENPALEWNNLEKGQPNSIPALNLCHITEKFDISIVAAPAMIYKDSTIISGHSMEVNFVTDIFLNISLQQIKLLSALLGEFVSLVEPCVFETGIGKRPKLTFPYTTTDDSVNIEEEILLVTGLDSGIDTSDMKSVQSSKAPATVSAVKTLYETEKQPVFPRPPNPLPSIYTTIPVDILFTGGKVGMVLYQIDMDKPHTTKCKGKKKKSSKPPDEDLGYDAGEESVEEKSYHNNYIPLLYVCITQPNAFISKHQLSKRLQISCFDFNLKISGPEYHPVNHVPVEDDFPVNLLETRSGIPDANTGILPAFFTLKYTKGIGKNASLEIEIAKPTKIVCTTSKWGHLLTVRDKVVDTFKGSQSQLVLISESVAKSSVPSLPSTYTRTKTGDTYSKFQDIKGMLCGINSVTVKLNQVLLSVKSDSGHEVNLSIQKVKNHLTLTSRPEKLCNSLSLNSITMSVIKENYKKILLNPWTVSVDVCVFWESWQSLDSDPQIHITAESDCIVLDVSPEQIKCVEMVIKDINEFLSTLPFKEETPKQSFIDTFRAKPLERDQHYKDDLRAGAFQFVDSNTENTDELPLPYQVIFWNRSISAMAWRYPQPRALTKVRVFPVPYKNTLNSQNDFLVLCHLEYWSECRNCYLPFTQFYLSESEVCHLSLPDPSPQPIAASIWRVVITMVDEIEDMPSSALISPRALAACMRIDSYFNKLLVANLTAALYVTKIEMSLYSYFDKSGLYNLPDCLKAYASDLFFPESQKFLTLTCDNLTTYFSSWENEMFSVEVSSSIKCSILDYAFLTEQPFLEPFTFKLEASLSDKLHLKFISRPIQLKFGPSVAHTLAVSSQLWQQTSKSDTREQDFVIVSRYVICNNTNINIRFGQTATDEDILLPSMYFHSYSWRSQKKKQQLKVALEENEWIWSKSFSIFEDGIQTIHFSSEKDFTMILSVKSLSATQKQVTISGQLIISNMSTRQFELKIVEAVKENKELEFKNSPSYILSGRRSSPSIFIGNKKKYYLRLRFYGLDSAWTGDIPLREHVTGSQPWLVKVPIQERGQFLSVWCKIVTQEVQRVKRILAVLWPLFMVKSNLPIDANVHIETPTLKVQLETIVQGKGKLQELYCPGTIDHSHQLMFRLDETDSKANPYVPMNYSLVDQHTFFKKNDKQDIDEILDILSTFGDSNWPYFGDELDDIDWVIEEQPLTHVQVRYQNACLHSCSLLVELLPWCLIVNTLGTPVHILLNGIELCKIPHHGIIAPPKLEENFHLGINASSSNSAYYSGPLQLAKSDWSQAFYMPKISGTIPLEGSIKTVLTRDSLLSMVSITSTISNEIRLVKISSTHVLSNHMSVQLQVVCLAVPEGDKIYEFPENLEQYCFTVAPHLHKSQSGISIMQWYSLTQNCDCNTDYALYIVFCVKPQLGWSCPIRIDKPPLRKSFCVMTDVQPIPIVLTSQEHRGQTFLAIHDDVRPQMFIENRSGATLFCAQALGEGKVAVEVQHFSWHCKVKGLDSVYYSMPLLSEKFPELPQNNFAEKIALACDPESDINAFQWSSTISIINDNEQFIRIPYYGDIKLTIINSACTTFLTIESVSQVEISAKDIRVRLSMHENSTSKAKEKSDLNSPTYDIVSRSVSDTVVNAGRPQSKFQKLPTVSEQCNANSSTFWSHPKRRWSDTNTAVASTRSKSFLVNTVPMKEYWSCIKLDAFVKSFSVILLSDLEGKCHERWELANLICDNIAVSAIQTECINFKLSISEIQLDNQLYSKESFDFPVVLISQDPTPSKKLSSLNIPIESLIENDDEDALLIVGITLETWQIQSNKSSITGVKNVKVTINPLSCYIEDIYITRLLDYLNIFMPTRLVVWPTPKTAIKLNLNSRLVSVPEFISWQCAILAMPLTVRNITIDPVSLLLSVHSSIKLYIALDQSPLQFGRFERKRLFTTPYRLGHAFTMHYLSGAIFGAGWVVSSLELLGSPGGLARAMGIGLRDFVSLPYRGLVIGPMAFCKGITQGSASLMKHVTAGTLQSVTKLASSVARNLDRLTLDEEHLKRTEEQRRQRPQGLAQGFIQGLTGLGISMLGAVGGIAHHPLQSVMSEGASPRSLAAGVGLGLVGVFTKPLSGAAELVALTGQGLLQGAGWNSLPEPRTVSGICKMSQALNSVLKYNWKLMASLSHSQLLYVTEATSITNNSEYNAIALLLTIDALILIDTEEDEVQRIISLAELSVMHNNDPTMLAFKLTPPLVQVKSEDETIVDMDPACRARVADYVRSTVGLLNLSDSMENPDYSEFNVSPIMSPDVTPNVREESTVLTYYVNPQSKNYFLCLLSLAKYHRHNYTFPVL